MGGVNQNVESEIRGLKIVESGKLGGKIMWQVEIEN